MLAPPWIPVPPPAYGGIEQVVDLLADRLVARGHDVTLFAAPGTRSRARVVPLLDEPQPDEIERALHEADHVARAFAAIDAAHGEGIPFDVVHDHCGFTALAMCDRLTTPLVHTVHGPFDAATRAFYAHHGHKATRLVAISDAQRASAPGLLRVAMAMIHNPIDVAAWPFTPEKDEYLLWMARMAPVKGAHDAIAAARLAGRPLVLAGPVQPGQEEYFAREVEPHVDGDAVRYVGPVGGEEKARLMARAAGFLMPVRWPEPFGLTMAEAAACGTPVLAYPEGAAAEVVRDGVTGFHADGPEQLAAAVARLGEIDPGVCRRVAERCWDASAVARRHEEVYRAAAMAAAWRDRRRRARRGAGEGSALVAPLEPS